MWAWGAPAVLMFTRFPLCSATVGLSIVLTMAPIPARAVDPNQPATSYIRTTFSVEDGLSSNVVNAIVQTRNGFLWIGTDAGLNRFDGRHFTPIYFRGPRATPQGIVSAPAEGAGRRFVDWDQRRPGPHPTSSAGSIRPILIGLLSSRYGLPALPSVELKRARIRTCSLLATRDLSSWTERGSWSSRGCRIN
jgi:hypothetical protein